jgi:hypothetical protein
MAITDWKPRKKTTRLSYGYNIDPSNPKWMIPDSHVVSCIEAAFDSLEAGISLREAADSLNSKSGCQILTHAGLRMLYDKMRPNHPMKVVQPKPKTQRMPRAERSKYRKRIKVAADKRKITAALKRIEKGEIELGRVKAEEASRLEELTAPVIIRSEVEEVSIEREQIRPHPGPQTEFLSAPEQEVLYGGAAGGGKSFAMLLDPLRHVDNGKFFGVLLRRTTDELRKLINESQYLYKRIYPSAKWKEQKSTWVFPSGAELWMTYQDNDRELSRFQGQEYSWVGVDELTHYPTPYMWDYLRTRLRSTTEANLPSYMRATTNPGGPGHGWVKKMFIDPAPPNTSFVARRSDTDEPMYIPVGDPGFPEEMWGKPMFYRRFIPAKLSDNPSLGWQYRANLLSQDENTGRKLLDGDWSVAEGAAFSEFRVSIHTCRPFEIPKTWMRFRSCDYGYSQRQYSAVHWYAVDPNYGTLYVYRELYVNQLTGAQLQTKINEIEREAGDSVAYAVLDGSVWSERGTTGPTIGEEMQRAGGRWRRADRSQGSRTASKNRLHELLRVDPDTGKPGIIFFDTCRQIITDLPMIPSAPPEQKEQDDIDRKYASDHAYDSIRYGIQTRPRGDLWDYMPQEKVFRPSDRTFGY